MAGIKLTPEQMAGFQPDAAPTPDAAPVKLSPQQAAGFQPTDATAGATPPAEGPSKWAALGRGALQGATLGFSDEITGAIESALSDKSYKQARDEARAANKTAEEAHSNYYAGGQVAGGLATMLVPGLNIAKGASVAAAAGTAALAGGLAGLGSSEADLRPAAISAGNVGRAAVDTGIGVAIGGAVGAAGAFLGKLISNAPTRAEAAALAGLKGPEIQNSTKIKAFGPRGKNEASIRQILKGAPEVRDAITNNSPKAVELVDGKIDALDSTLKHIYSQADSAGKTIPFAEVKAAVAQVEQGYRKAGASRGMADAIKAAGQHLEDVHGQAGTLTFEQLHNEVSLFGAQGFEGGPMFSVPAGKQLKRDITFALREVLQSNVDQVAKADPALGISRKLLQDTNGEITAWLRIEPLLDQKLTRAAANAPGLGKMLSKIELLRQAGEAAKGVGRKIDTNLLGPAVRIAGKTPLAPVLAGAHRGGLHGVPAPIAGGAVSYLSPPAEDDEPGPAIAGTP
jgi:hypothetical protein